MLKMFFLKNEISNNLVLIKTTAKNMGWKNWKRNFVKVLAIKFKNNS